MKFIQSGIKKQFIFFALILISNTGFSQQKIKNNLFKSDSAIVYIGVINQFKINAGEKIDLVGGARGVSIKQKDGILEIASSFPGTFPVSFKTDIGVKKVVLISKTLTVEQIKSGIY